MVFLQVYMIRVGEVYENSKEIDKMRISLKTKLGKTMYRRIFFLYS